LERCRTKRSRSPRNFRSSAQKDFCDTIGGKQTFSIVDQVGTAEAADEALDPLKTVDHRCAARRGDGERHGFGAGCCSDVAKLLDDLVQRFVPGNFTSAWIGGVTWRGPAQRFGQPSRTMRHLGCGAALGTKRISGRMLRQVLDADHLSFVGDRGGAAPRSAKRSIAGMRSTIK
jgi:hypothetical protein